MMTKGDQDRVRALIGDAKVAEILVGVRPPQYTSDERDALASPATGTLIYNTTTNKLNFYSGSAWEAVTSA